MLRFAVIALALAACSKKDNSNGLPPAQEWGADQGAPAGGAGAGGANNPHAVDPDNPHAGLGLNAEGEPETDDNPHATMGGGGDPTNPHAGMGGAATDVSKLGLPPPDPNRPIDPTHHVKGVIKIDPKAVDRAKPGGAIFVIVKRADATGAPTGTPLAVDKLTWQKDQVPFDLGEAQAMIAGTQLVGDVVVTARYDQDGDALTKQPGDVIGQIRVKIPAENVKLVLDQVLP